MFESFKWSLKAWVSENMHQESLQWYQLNTRLLRNTEYANFQISVVIMRSLPFKKYQTCELKSKIIDYRGYSVKIYAFYRASATALTELLVSMYVLRYHTFLRYIYL